MVLQHASHIWYQAYPPSVSLNDLYYAATWFKNHDVAANLQIVVYFLNGLALSSLLVTLVVKFINGPKTRSISPLLVGLVWLAWSGHVDFDLLLMQQTSLYSIITFPVPLIPPVKPCGPAAYALGLLFLLEAKGSDLRRPREVIGVLIKLILVYMSSNKENHLPTVRYRSRSRIIEETITIEHFAGMVLALATIIILFSKASSSIFLRDVHKGILLAPARHDPISTVEDYVKSGPLQEEEMLVFEDTVVASEVKEEIEEISLTVINHEERETVAPVINNGIDKKPDTFLLHEHAPLAVSDDTVPSTVPLIPASGPDIEDGDNQKNEEEENIREQIRTMLNVMPEVIKLEPADPEENLKTVSETSATSIGAVNVTDYIGSELEATADLTVAEPLKIEVVDPVGLSKESSDATDAKDTGIHDATEAESVQAYSPTSSGSDATQNELESPQTSWNETSFDANLVKSQTLDEEQLMPASIVDLTTITPKQDSPDSQSTKLLKEVSSGEEEKPKESVKDAKESAKNVKDEGKKAFKSASHGLVPCWTGVESFDILTENYIRDDENDDRGWLTIEGIRAVVELGEMLMKRRKNANRAETASVSASLLILNELISKPGVSAANINSMSTNFFRGSIWMHQALLKLFPRTVPKITYYDLPMEVIIKLSGYAPEATFAMGWIPEPGDTWREFFDRGSTLLGIEDVKPDNRIKNLCDWFKRFSGDRTEIMDRPIIRAPGWHDGAKIDSNLAFYRHLNNLMLWPPYSPEVLAALEEYRSAKAAKAEEDRLKAEAKRAEAELAVSARAEAAAASEMGGRVGSELAVDEASEEETPASLPSATGEAPRAGPKRRRRKPKSKVSPQ